MNGTKWVFLDIGSTLMDESLAVRRRVERTVAWGPWGFTSLAEPRPLHVGLACSGTALP